MYSINKKQHNGTPDVSTKYKTYRAVGRPRKRWEDEINDFLISDAKNNVERNNNGWIKTAKDQKGGMKMESKFAIAAATSPGSQHQRRKTTGGWYDT